MLVSLGQVPLLLEDDPRAEVGMAVVGLALENAREELKGFIEVAQRGAAAGLLGRLNLLAGHVQESDGQVDRAGDPPGARWLTSRKASAALPYSYCSMSPTPLK